MWGNEFLTSAADERSIAVMLSLSHIFFTSDQTNNSWIYFLFLSHCWSLYDSSVTNSLSIIWWFLINSFNSIGKSLSIYSYTYLSIWFIKYDMWYRITRLTHHNYKRALAKFKCVKYLHNIWICKPDESSMYIVDLKSANICILN